MIETNTVETKSWTPRGGRLDILPTRTKTRTTGVFVSGTLTKAGMRNTLVQVRGTNVLTNHAGMNRFLNERNVSATGYVYNHFQPIQSNRTAVIDISERAFPYFQSGHPQIERLAELYQLIQDATDFVLVAPPNGLNPLEFSMACQWWREKTGELTNFTLIQDHQLTQSAWGLQKEQDSVPLELLERAKVVFGLYTNDELDALALPDAFSYFLNSLTQESDTIETLESPNGCHLRGYQQQMADFVLKKKRCGLFIDMGLGKTFSTIASLDELVKLGELDVTKPVLIVAPIMVAVDTWSREAEKWGYDFDVKVNVGLTKKKREALLDTLLEPQEKVTLVTTNPQQLKPMFDYFRSKGVSNVFDAVVVDELSMFKSPTAQRFMILSEETKDAQVFIGLTGTPAPNNLIDIWSQLIVIDPKNKSAFGKNFFLYRNLFFEPDVVANDGTVYKWKLKEDAEDEIFRRMRQSVITMRTEGLLELPSISYSNLHVQMPRKAWQLYREMEYTLKAQLKDKTLEFANPAVLTGKLIQLATGALYTNILSNDASDDVEYEVFHDEKFKALKELAENATSPLLVFYYFKSDLDRIPVWLNEYEVLDPHQANVQEVIAKWNRGEIPVLLAHPASAGHGLNLQDGGHTIVWLTPTWSNEQYRQANKRLHRSGQKHPVSVIHIVADGTRDESVIERLDDKEDGQERLMKALDVAKR